MKVTFQFNNGSIIAKDWNLPLPGKGDFCFIEEKKTGEDAEGFVRLIKWDIRKQLVYVDVNGFIKK